MSKERAKLQDTFSDFIGSMKNKLTLKTGEVGAVPLVSEIEEEILMSLSDRTLNTPSNLESGCGGREKERNELNVQQTFFESVVFLNSKFKTPAGPSTSKETKDKKPKKTSKKQDTTFPKYLSEEEMKNISNFGLLHSGFIRINQKNFNEAYISAPDKGMDILIDGILDRNRALEGDEVYYVLKDKEDYKICADTGESRRTAIVVALKSLRHSRCAVGTLEFGKKATLIPRDSRLPKIRIRKNDWPRGFSENPKSFENKLYYARINEWSNIRYAKGEIVKEVGLLGDIEAETSAILLMFDLDVTPYSDSFSQYLPQIPYNIPDEEIKSRRDLRGECIFTIDPATAKDLDDAMSCKILANGNYEIGVHISDVTHFLSDGTPLDEAISRRATSIYLVQRVYHMLPRELCELCSLTPGEDKLAFSVIWEMTPEFRIVDYSFTRSVINSCGKFSYEQVQDILDNTENLSMPEIHGGHSIDFIKEAVKALNQIAVHLREKRFENGALRIDQTKITFELDSFGLPLNYSVYVNTESHRLIEEFMLLANITVAERINSFYPKIAFLRSHAPPAPHMLAKIQQNLKKFGIEMDVTSSKTIHSSLCKYSGSDTDSLAKMMVLNNLLARPMTKAMYYCSDFYDENNRRHYALNVDLYTHFTSPIRRYADVMVHRLLAASLGYSDTPNWSPDKVQMVADNCNKQKYSAKLAGEKSTELFLDIFFIQRKVSVYEAVVCYIKYRSFECILLENGSHQIVKFQDIEGEWAVEKDNGVVKLIITCKNKSVKNVRVIKMFDIVKVELRECKKSNKMRTKLLNND